MQADLIGRVNNTKLSMNKPLLPLFEGIINSFDAIEESGRTDGYIKIYVERDHSQGSLLQEEYDLDPIRSFVIEDNGIGFIDNNMDAFTTADSRIKVAKGGKGVGRFLWLRAFDSVKIQSTYFESDRWNKRTFDFKLTQEGIHDHEVVPSEVTSPITKVHLLNLQEKYQKNCPKRISTIAHKIVEHCIVHFMSEDCPKISLTDQDNIVSLNEIFETQIEGLATTDTFTLNDLGFLIKYLKLYSPEVSQHRLSLCANNREVTSENLKNYIPDLIRRLKDDEDKLFVFRVYVSGNYLDQNVTCERTDFVFADSNELNIGGEVTGDQLREQILKNVKNQLDAYLKVVREEKKETIQNFVNNEAPQYRPLLTPKYEHHISDIPPGLTEQKLELELHERMNKIELDLKKKGAELLKTDIDQITELDKYKEDYERFIEEINEIGKSNLAKYIIHRKVILDLLDNNLKMNRKGKYELEKTVHKLILPLGRISHDVDFSQQNFWIIDEKLSYHMYLASDRKLKTIDVVDTHSEERPDLVVFNTPFAFIEGSPPYRSIEIIEFKRPGREDYKENPIEQIYRYVEKIRDGTVRDKDGRPIEAGKVPYYGYIICDINQKIRDFASYGPFTETPDRSGFYGYNPNYDCYIEITSYNKLSENAKRRNRILFDKLGLPFS